MPLARSRGLVVGLVVGLVFLLASATSWSQERTRVVLPPVINFHAAPRADSAVVTQALLGARLVELASQEGWSKVKGEDEYPGWVEARFLRPLAAGERYPSSLEPGRAIEVDALSANLYFDPDVTTRAPVLTVPFGVRLERVMGGKDTSRWLEVRLPDHRLAWIQQGDVRTDLRPRSLEAALEVARRFQGITYTWGGSSTFGFDCSGFTQAILRTRGLSMPRDANQQAEWPGLAGVANPSLLVPGDLLFFGRDATHITHTGLYLGQGNFIHDTPREHPRVQISALADPTWSKLLVAMRRAK